MSMASWFRRGGVVAGGVVVSVLLAACSAGSPAEPPSASGGPTTESSTSSDPSGVEIADPKDAAAVDVCSLLPPEAAQKVGVRPQGEKRSSLTIPDDSSKTCVWESPKGSTRISFSPIPDRSIQQYYDNPDSFVDFEKLRIAGYPAVRANGDDPMTGGSCDVFLAPKRNQVVQSTSFVPSDEVGTVNPCKFSKKMLELSVSSWPDVE